MEVSTDSSPDPIKTTIIDEKTKGTIYKRLYHSIMQHIFLKYSVHYLQLKSLSGKNARTWDSIDFT